MAVRFPSFPAAACRARVSVQERELVERGQVAIVDRERAAQVLAGAIEVVRAVRVGDAVPRRTCSVASATCASTFV